MTIGIISAMQKEQQQLVSLLESPRTEERGPFAYTVGQLNGNSLVLQQCGIGKVNAAVGAAELINHYHPSTLISTGVAGGIDQSLDIMDVVVGQQVVYHDVTIPGCELGQVQGLPALFDGDASLVASARSLDDARIHVGLICSGDQFISDRDQLATIKNHFPEGLAVDMESGALAQVCYLYKVPFLSFRIISDTPGSDGHVAQYFDFWERMAAQSFDITRRFLLTL